MEVIHRLLNFDKKVIFQNDEWFLFSIDSLLLANFVTLKKKDKKILDLCTGNAPIPMFLTYKTNAEIFGIEIQKEVFCLGVKSIEKNNFVNQITLINDDIKCLNNYFSNDTFDVITCNPPYFKVNNQIMLNNNDIKAIARHEVCCNLDDILFCSKSMLKTGGILAMVHTPDRLVEIIQKMIQYKIEPKKIQFVYSKEHTMANMLLIEGVKNGKGGMKILEPLYIHNNDGTYKEVIKKMFQE